MTATQPLPTCPYCGRELMLYPDSGDRLAEWNAECTKPGCPAAQVLIVGDSRDDVIRKANIRTKP